MGYNVTVDSHKLSIIIVSYNTKDLTIQAIRSVLGLGEIIVVDNDSSDGSVAALRQEFANSLTIIANGSNVGFAKANNQGIKIATGTYVLLLNSDTIASKEAVEGLTHALDSDEKFGIVSCRLLNRDGSYQPQGGALPSLFNLAVWWLWPLPGELPGIDPYQSAADPVGNTIVERGWVGGTAMCIRRSVIEEIGGLDEKIFMYAEDVDLCIRARQKGYKIGIVPTLSITHLGSASGGSSTALLGEIKGLLYLFSKYYPSQRAFLKLILWKGALLRLLLFGILRGDETQRKLYSTMIREIRKSP